MKQLFKKCSIENNVSLKHVHNNMTEFINKNNKETIFYLSLFKTN